LSPFPWGKRRNINGLSDVTDSLVGQTTDRGFTMHEHLDEMGLVHMNGRIYDPLIGRFMSADPILQAPGMLQSHNRYAYVMNNPLNLTDPSGFSWWTRFRDKWVRPIVAIAAAVYFGPFGAGTGGFVGGGALFSFGLANAAFAGAVSGAISTGTVQGAVRGAFSGALFFGVGEFVPGAAGSAGKVLAHAAAGCVSSVASGGSCGSGALAAGFGEAIGPHTPKFQNLAANVAVRAVVGGIGSSLAGGKFENGAVTAAFGYLFNELPHQTTAEQQGYANSTNAKGASVLYGPVEGGDLYARRIFVQNAEGHTIATYSGSIEPDLNRVNCADGCPTIAVGTHAISAQDRVKYGGTILVVGNNGTVPTAGPNPNQGGNSFATGVYVHTGFPGFTGAEGCLTVNPAQWKSFISHFPTGTRGTLNVVK
jgi:RHS repeat-associated protein